MSTTALSAAAADRKARLAQLKTLKRKAPSSDLPETSGDFDITAQHGTSPRPLKSPRQSPSPTADADDLTAAATTSKNPHLSGRNYDPLTRGPKLGFEAPPVSVQEASTVEARAKALEDAARAEQARTAGAEKEQETVDLFSLQPKKANWDLKRELERRVLESGAGRKLDLAVGRLVRERIEGRKKAGGGGTVHGTPGREAKDGERQELGMEGATLVEATKEREREDEEEARRERELDADLEEP